MTTATADQAAPDDVLTWQSVCILAGISYRQLDYWARVGHSPGGSSPGHGFNWGCTPAMARRAGMLGRRTEAGMLPAFAAEVAAQIETTGRADLGGGFTLTWTQPGDEQ